ncbi:MAG: extracellular solute-binding protein [Clostridia bacterium]|nr:extracellular solute-binding protein [Clostridia bacterium]
MKKIVSFLCVVALLVSAFSILAVPVAAATVTDDSHTVSVDVNAVLKDTPVEITAEVDRAGEYKIGLLYKSLDDMVSVMELDIEIDGVNPAVSGKKLTLPKFWTSEEEFRLDGAGNQFAPEQVLYKESATHYFTEVVDYRIGYCTVELTAGTHTVKITPANTNVLVEKLLLTVVEPADAYAAPDSSEYYDGDAIIIEGESSPLKNNYWLKAGADGGSSKVYPNDPIKVKVNNIGGSTWKESGDTIYWYVDAPKAGYYKVAFSYKQNKVLNGNVYRWLRVNGKTPFAEAESIAFPYASDWDIVDFADEDNAYLVYLKEGKNEISLTGTMGTYSETAKMLNEIVQEIGDLYLDINMVTGDTVDVYRDYQLFNQIPGFNDTLKAIHERLKTVEEQLIAISNGETSSDLSSVKNMANTIQYMYENPYRAHRYKTTYYSNYTALSAAINDMQDIPMSIDRIYLLAPEDEANEASSNIFKRTWFSFLRFIASFTEDYNNISGTTDSDSKRKVTLWVNWGRDQAQIFNSLIQSDFTVMHPDIQVDLKIANASVIQGVISGNGPDVILNQVRTEPVNLALRGVLYNLSSFDDCDEVLKQFVDGAEIPYMYEGNLYALPDTQGFNMLYYRTDVFEELGLQVPKTWDEFKTVARVLTRRNFDVWLPYSQITDVASVNGGIGSLSIFPTLMIQNGLSMYNEEQTATTLTSSEVVSVFTDWVHYYTRMKLPYQLDFYNRFRTGTCPMGIASYTTYNTIKDTAKEIDGKWQMAELPGVVDENGNLNNSSSGSGTGCSILKDAQDPEAAWEFLKWWVSADTQYAYSMSVESVLGPIGRISVSNVEAFDRMSWDSDKIDSIKAAWNKTVEIPEIPGSYYIARSIDFAFWNSSNGNENPKDMLLEWGREANIEIERKLKQYENRR